jgi:hypothetical protein
MKKTYQCTLCEWESSSFGGDGLPTRWPSRETVEHFQKEHTELVRGAENIWKALSMYIEVKDLNDA